MAMTIQGVEEHLANLEKVKKLLKKDIHYRLDKRGNRVMKRSGFALLAYIFHLSDKPPIQEELRYPDEKTYQYKLYRKDKPPENKTLVTDFKGFRITVEIEHKPSGRYASGVAACTMEEENIQSKLSEGRWYHDCLSTAHTRALNRAISNIIGSAEVSDEEISGGELGKSERKVVDIDQKVMLPELTEPSWKLEDEIKAQGWEAVGVAISTYLNDMGFNPPNLYFDWGSDNVKAWIKPIVNFDEAGFIKLDKNLTEEGFILNTNEGRWRYKKPRGQD